MGVYVGGSYALGDYRQGRSDLDVAAVTRETVPVATREAVVAALRHESLPCPARGLEFVLYPLAAARKASADPGFDLNLNTGERMRFRVDYEVDPTETHWFAIDRSILAEHGIALFGPPASEVFAPIPRDVMLPLLVVALHWHAHGDPPGDDAVLNACRTLRYAVERTMSSKPVAGKWAAGRVEDSDLVKQALAAREEGRQLEPSRVAAFIASVIADVEAAT